MSGGLTAACRRENQSPAPSLALEQNSRISYAGIVSDTATELPRADGLTIKQARILESHYALRQRLPGPSIGSHEIPSSVRAVLLMVISHGKYSNL